tara:strand:- start:2399 stop:3493 length:1095 start_codon:yes stop_codon:yes gene_type:complete
MKNILFFIPNIERGGIEKNLLILSNYLTKKNYNTEVICSKISKEVRNKLNNKVKIIKCKEYINLPFFSARVINSINAFIYCLFFYQTKNQQIVLSMQDHPFSIIVCKFKNLPCILRIANHPHGSLKFYNNIFNHFLKISIKKFFYFFSSGIICNSNSSTNYLKKIFKNKKIITIYNPIEVKFYKNKKISNHIISVGRLEKQKNFYGLIKAFKKVTLKYKNIKLIIVGSGSEEKRLKNLSKKLKIYKKIIFNRFQKADDQIKSSKLFVLNSLWEGLPNILIETQILKTPILSTNCESGPKEILLNGKIGYLTPINDYKKLAQKIIYIFENYNEAKKKAKLAANYLNRFDFNNQCKKYEVFLKTFS